MTRPGKPGDEIPAPPPRFLLRNPAINGVNLSVDGGWVML